MAELIKNLNIFIAENKSCIDFAITSNELVCAFDGGYWSCYQCAFDGIENPLVVSTVKILGEHSERTD